MEPRISKRFCLLAIMYRYRIDPLAKIELEQAGLAYESFFDDLGDYEKGVAWADRFYLDYAKAIDTISLNPYFYPVCTVYPFNELSSRYRSFRCGWFTVFYTVEEQSFTVWHIRSSRSDFTAL